ncbi:hypothetical protein CHU92_03420 [Flavobacterium cyanobacteriorum]|uniref:DUF559 domain-containing protein n=1 Tax=Flavobacterium cyanobacteriorum TaxID=2022802 RepID=A0A255ZPS1_9FLAO|nr:endonuclease domain-containing protein [Flavobacterium cyanobacteriorum]OYQ43456.1 hypothetical protein CHU92_03420 [Flavobacterium cyanobacteriorum]
MQEIIVTYINEHPIYRYYLENLPYNPALSLRAKALRKQGIYSEVVFWQQVHKRKFYNIDFDRQRIIGNYIADFYCKSLSLIIEIDGASHNDKEIYDDKRDAYLQSLGLKLFKVTDFRVLHDLENVMSELENFIITAYSKPPRPAGTPPQ